MIFVTVGTEMHFNRMVQPIDQWAGRNGRSDIFAQVGATDWKPRHIESVPYLDAIESRKRIAAAEVVIAHAGMGTILMARELGRPILVMPRRAEFGEHRNNHQLATARELSAQGFVTAAFDEEQLLAKLDQLEQLPCPARISSYASERLLQRITHFIAMGVTGPESAISIMGGDVAAYNARRPLQPAEANSSLIRGSQ